MAVWALKEISSSNDFERQKNIYYKNEIDSHVKNEWMRSDNQIRVTN